MALVDRSLLLPCLAAASLLAAVPAAAGEGGVRFRVVAMGDSLTDTKVGGGKFLSYLASRCPESRFESVGKGGQMVNQMRKRFGRDALSRPATHVLVMGGVNDLYSDETAGRTPAKIKADLSSMYDASRAAGRKVIALTIAPWGGFKHHSERRAKAHREVNAWVLGQREEGKVWAAVDTVPLLSCGDPDRLCEGLGMRDGLHWTAAGHEKVGQGLFEQVFSGCR